MIDRPAPRQRRTARERRQLHAFIALCVGVVLLLMPLFMHPAQRQAFDVLLPAGWCLVALGAVLQWRVPVLTPALLARQQEADLVQHHPVRSTPGSAVGTLSASIER